MKIIIPLVLIAIIGAFVVFTILQSESLSQDPAPEAIPLVTPKETLTQKKFVIGLLEQNDSGESGIATLTESGGQTTVVINLDSAPVDTPQPAHIHEGSCAEIGGVNYPLTDVVAGNSETTIAASLEQLRKELPLAINVHKSGPEIDVYVACGEFPADLMMEDEDGMMKENEVLGMTMGDADSQTAQLTAVDDSDSLGIAYRLAKNGILYHAVTASMPDPSSGNVYEGWLVQTSPLEFLSTGVLERNDEDMWQLEYTTNSEYPTYTRVVITEETVVDATPETHIIEGDF